MRIFETFSALVILIRVIIDSAGTDHATYFNNRPVY